MVKLQIIDCISTKKKEFCSTSMELILLASTLPIGSVRIRVSCGRFSGFRIGSQTSPTSVKGKDVQ